VASHEDSRHDCQHALSTFVHGAQHQAIAEARTSRQDCREILNARVSVFAFCSPSNRGVANEESDWVHGCD
jgi:hypothetical protein